MFPELLVLDREIGGKGLAFEVEGWESRNRICFFLEGRSLASSISEYRVPGQCSAGGNLNKFRV